MINLLLQLILFVGVAHLACCQDAAGRESRDTILVIGTRFGGGAELYDIRNDSWSRVAAIDNTCGGMLIRQGLAAGTLPAGGKSSMVYLCGGRAECRRYDPELDKCYSDVSRPVKTRSSSTLVNPGDGKLYKVGGDGMDFVNDDIDVSLPIERYDPVQNSWKVITNIPLPADEYGREMQLLNYATALGGAIYVAMRPMNESEAQPFYQYDVPSNSWTRLADIPAGVMYSQLVSSTSGSALGVIYAVSQCGDKLSHYKMADNRWQTVELHFPQTSTSRNRDSKASDPDYNNQCGGSVVLGPNKDGGQEALYLVGGSYKGYISAELFKLSLFEGQPTSGMWQHMSPMWDTRSDTAVVLIRKSID